MEQPVCCGFPMLRLCKEYMIMPTGKTVCLGTKYWCEVCGEEELII